MDYIVPGEMELMSAVRSVSCNSSMSKCNKTDGDDEEYGPNSESAPLTGDCPPPPPPPNGSSLSCSNPDLVQVRDRQREEIHYLVSNAGHQAMGEELSQGPPTSHARQLPASEWKPGYWR